MLRSGHHTCNVHQHLVHLKRDKKPNGLFQHLIEQIQIIIWWLELHLSKIDTKTLYQFDVFFVVVKRDLTSLFDFTAGHTVHLLESVDSPDTWNLECAAQLNVTLCIVIIIITIIIIVVIIVTIIIIDTSILLYSSSKICLRPRFLARITALYLVELQNTWQKVEQKIVWKARATYAIYLKSWGFKDVKYDIPMCQSHSTRPYNEKRTLYVIFSGEIGLTKFYGT